MRTKAVFWVTLFSGLVGCNELFDIGVPKPMGEGGEANTTNSNTGGGEGGSGGKESTTKTETGGSGAGTNSTGGGGTGGNSKVDCGNGVLDDGEACDFSVPGEATGLCSPECHPATIAGITAGDAHTCVLLQEQDTSKGFVKCWGDNTYGQLGTATPGTIGDEPGEMGAALPVVDLGAGNPVRVVAGGTHTCAILSVTSAGARGQKLKCWGNNLYGQLGLGDKIQRGNLPGQMGDKLPDVDLGTGALATDVAPGRLHTCALLAGGAVKCWGSNAHNQAGQDDTALKIGDDPMEMGDALSPITSDMAAISSGEFHTCGIYESGEVRCWGINVAGQLGLGNTDPQGILEKIPFLQLAAKPSLIRCAGERSCARLTTQEIQCWGKNDVGQLGLMDTQSFGDDFFEAANLPVLVIPGPAIAFALGGQHSCADFGPAGFKCWGNNSNGQLGLGATFSPNFIADAPAKIVSVEMGSGFATSAIAGGESHTCAVSPQNRIKCWGKNGSGQLGLGHTNDVGLKASDMGNNLNTTKVSSTGF